MARGTSTDNWDFVKVGETYQYKEDSWIAMVKVLEDNSTEEAYKFQLQIEKSNWPSNGEPKEFTLFHNKKFDGIYTGMAQLYKSPEYAVDYKWVKQ